MTEIIHPEVKVSLLGTDSNIFALIAKVVHAMRHKKVPEYDISRFRDEVTSSVGYDEALQVIMRWVDVK